MKTVEELQIENEKLRAENAQLRIHAPYGVLTRVAFEIEKRKLTSTQYVVFGDIDDMHSLNAKYGYEAVNQMIRSALQARSDDLLLTGLWFSGDEFVFIVRSDPEGFCTRLKSSFADRDMGITLAHASIADHGSVDAAIQATADNVQLQKVNRR